MRRLSHEFVAAGTGMETLASVDPSVIQWFAAMATRAIEKSGYKEAWEQNPYWQGLYIAGADGSAYRVVDDRIVRFRARVDAKAWGANTNTWHQPPGRFPLVIAMVEANDAIARAVSPVWRAYGADYDDPADRSIGSAAPSGR